MQTAILCGGRGTRLREYTDAIPKAMVEVGGRPILWHIMKIYSHYGFSDFVLAAGYLGEQISGWLQAERRGGDDRWSVDVVDTGADTPTGGRITRLRDHIAGDQFFATYGDGVADIDLRRLLDFHRHHGRVATVTVVRPRLQFGLLGVADDDRVESFVEKPRVEGWVNGGFFVFDRRIFDYLDANSPLEEEPMSRLAADGELMAFRHDGFWACMDTYKDNVELNSAWESGEAPWLVWNDG